jgi:hypothetical protein
MTWFSKKTDVTKAEQMKEVQDVYGNHPHGKLFIKMILEGLDCDELPNSTGQFACIKNPIPVNGYMGEIIYLKRLRCECGAGIIFHRIGSTKLGLVNNNDDKALDIYETVCLEGKHWDILFFDMYHPRRSLKTPEGYTNALWDNLMSPTPIAFGTNATLTQFPADMPHHLEERFGPKLGSVMARQCSTVIGDGSRFKAPDDHISRKNNYVEAIKGNTVAGVFQAVADMGDKKSDGVIFF